MRAPTHSQPTTYGEEPITVPPEARAILDAVDPTRQATADLERDDPFRAIEALADAINAFKAHVIPDSVLVPSNAVPLTDAQRKSLFDDADTLYWRTVWGTHTTKDTATHAREFLELCETATLLPVHRECLTFVPFSHFE